MPFKYMVERISSLAYFVEHLELHFESSEVLSFENHESIKYAFYSQCNETRKVLKEVSCKKIFFFLFFNK